MWSGVSGDQLFVASENFHKAYDTYVYAITVAVKGTACPPLPHTDETGIVRSVHVMYVRK